CTSATSRSTSAWSAAPTISSRAASRSSTRKSRTTSPRNPVSKRSRRADGSRLRLRVLPRITGAVLEDVGLAINREDDGAFVGVSLVEGAHASPDVLARPADPVVVVERALDDIGLLDLGMLVHRERGARLPLQ